MFRRRTRTRGMAAVMGLAVMSACESDVLPQPADIVVTDSGGVTIVESTMPQWAQEDRWWVDPVPEVVIGGSDPGEKYAFGNVVGVARFADGRIAVLDGRASVVRIYDPAGEHLFDVGGPGQGPGEFRSPQFVKIVQDSIVVYQQTPPTLTWFDESGRFVRSVLLARTSSGRQLYGPAHGFLGRDGVIVLADPPVPPRTGPEPGVTSRPRGLWRLELDGSFADSLSAVRGEQIVVHGNGRFNRLTFGSTTHATSSDAWIYVADSRAYSIEMRDREGTVRRVVRKSAAPRPVTDDDIDGYADRLIAVEGIPAEQRASRNRYRVRDACLSQHFRGPR